MACRWSWAAERSVEAGRKWAIERKEWRALLQNNVED